MSIDASYSRDDRLASWRRVFRLIGWTATILIGPVVGLVAWKTFDMGPFEITALVFLLSFWIGPLLMMRWKSTSR